MATMVAPYVAGSFHSCKISYSSALTDTSSSVATPASFLAFSSQVWSRESSGPFKTGSKELDAHASKASPAIRSKFSSSRRNRFRTVSASFPTSFSQQSPLQISPNFLTFNPLSNARSSTFCVPQARKLSEVEITEDKEEQLASAPVEEEEEVEISWIQEKAEDIVFATSQAIDRVPGPRVGDSRLPWLVAVPLGYLGITFVIAVVKTFRKYNSPRGQRKRQVGKNAFLCEELGEYFPSKRDQLDSNRLQKLAKQCNFSLSEVLRKYVRYALNERPFTLDTVADLIHLRKVSGLAESEVAEVLNDVAKRVVKAKGPVVMNTEGFTEKGIKRKAAVQALFSKLLYLSEMEEFVSSENRSALTIKTTFGLTDEDANQIRIDTLSEQSDVESLERMVGSADSESDNEEVSSSAGDKQ